MIENIYKNPEVAYLLAEPSDDVIVTDEGLIATHVEISDQLRADLKQLGVVIVEEEQVICG